MYRTLIIFAALFVLSAQDKPESVPIPDSSLVVYWRLVAVHYSTQAAYANSLTVQQKQMLENLDKVNKDIDAQRLKMCGDKTFDESGATPVCVTKVKK